MTEQPDNIKTAKQYLGDAETAEPTNPIDDTALVVQMSQAHAMIAIAEALQGIRQAIERLADGQALLPFGRR